MSAGNLACRMGLGAALVCLGCKGTSVPKAWLPTPQEAQTTAFGGWIDLAYTEANERRWAVGELIAASADSVWILNQREGLVIPTAAVDSGKLFAYAPRTGNITGWTVAGTVSTISNGAFLLFTAPMWIIGGSLAGRSEIRAAQRNNPPLTWVEIAPFARFPQGMPEGVGLAALRPKPPAPRDTVSLPPPP
jgi:hypothetical protein